ncbi:Por secretion system C-terminal sorting domain-containing protein [Winogradskyella jejuensis]|uniref:Por secretion system C-terminal sorting domain-containing protein n=2 Tax=Winogradskyella jejuensis TaxID=1089305 RepID=A0A1M5KG92_9FLAO|nr:Por secretion system C-terminal sorting domain-containing protein [Winogradskyella jejuensis]
MKKIIALLLLLIAWSINGQNQNVRQVTASQAIQENNYTILVGPALLGIDQTPDVRNTQPLDVRFPWDILYLPNTFSDNAFDVSKGYFGDMIRISWTVQANFDLLTNIAIFRREYTEDGSNPFVQIANTAPIATEYEDEFVEGGVLYEYMIEAQGIGGNAGRLLTFIDGIGYRSPTAIVTGSVNFEGGNPVQDVILKAEAQGNVASEGSTLAIPFDNSLAIENTTKVATTAATLQAYLKPQQAFTNGDAPIRLFNIVNQGSTSTIPVDVSVTDNASKLNVNIGGAIYTLNNYYPSGELDALGNDLVVPISDFNSNFVHFSVVIRDNEIPELYINGRFIGVTYPDTIATYEPALNPAFTVEEPTNTIELSIGGNPTNWQNFFVGGNKDSFVDEVRIWDRAVEPDDIRIDYRRFISGNNSSLIAYLRANERVGQFAYDLSRSGFNYNNNHGRLFNEFSDPNRITWETNVDNIPTESQLGVLGVTDANGNYEITAIPYSGTGESFTITPIFGVHQFEPNQQLVYLGQGSEVVNSINFTDISSFSFKGRVLYDSRGVFPSFVELNTPMGATAPDFSNLTDGDEYVSQPGIIDEGYNFYQKGTEKYQKGEYWYNDNNTPGDTSDDYLERYARIASPNVNVFIDGEIVLDENNIPVVTDGEGFFDVQVPIGNHFITIGLNGHEFIFDGRFPAASGSLEEFFEDRNEVVTFIDDTKVTLVGRVVGGSVESQKEIGFGADGLVEASYVDSNGISQNETISSKNNIGVANLTLGYRPLGSPVTPFTEFSFSTNIESGEYRVEALPLQYTIDQVSGLSIPSNTAISILDSNEDVNLLDIPEPTIPEFTLGNGQVITADAYQYERSFTYRSTPVLSVLAQTSDSSISINGTEYSTEGFSYPIYSQALPYYIRLKRFESYTNFDDSADVVEDIVPVTDGELLVTNNLALIGSEAIEVDTNDPSIIDYSFKGGIPRISSPFTKTINLAYRLNGVDYPVEPNSYIDEGIIIGGAPDGSQTFTTAAPDIPDIILRDPPGSNSFASIQSGESITLTTSSSVSDGQELSQETSILIGGSVSITNIPSGLNIETSNTANINSGISVSKTSNSAEELSKTYTFSQTISTSSDPDFVGADGDLYIGQSKNYFYGSYDDVYSSATPLTGSNALELTNVDGESVFLSLQKSMYFVEEPSDTFFVFSQKQILENIIPDLELIIQNIDNGIVTPSQDGVQSRFYYEQQIRLWRKTILENERRKYISINDRENAKAEALSNLDAYIQELNDAIDNANANATNTDSDLATIEVFLPKLQDAQQLRNLVLNNFSDNISFDAGVGEFTRSIETAIAVSTSNEVELEIDGSLALELEISVNKVGIASTTTGSYGEGITSATTLEQENTTEISYTLTDNDADNVLSVDVVNLFDGNGPVFSTIGGQTSCPYEGQEFTVFYNPTTYVADGTDPIEPLPDELRVPLNVATQRIENPAISVEVASVTNVPESQNAEFELILENNSVTGTDATYLLIVDNTTNPNNAIINIEQNGTLVNVPFGEQVFYSMTLGKSISDVNVYQDIRVVLQSLCDSDNIFDDVFVSAEFVPACSAVRVTGPLDNWVYNRDTAFNLDGSTNPLQIELSEFNLAFNSFEKIDLEYRLASSPTWTRLQTYYTTQAFFDNAVANNETEISLINDSNLTFPFNIASLGLADGNYEVRARTSCTNNTDFTSDVISGTVDLTAPTRFNTPTPTDGILSVGEDLKVSFNEDIFYNSAVSLVEIKGRTNQLPINNNVSLFFGSPSNTASIEQPDISNGDFSLEFWMNNQSVGTNATVISQNAGLQVTIDSNVMSFTLGGETITAGIFADDLFHHYTLTYNSELNTMSIYQDDTELSIVNNVPELVISNNNDLIIGGNDFVGNIHDIRLWEKHISLPEAFANIYTQYVGNETGLTGYWPMDEGRGNTARDVARFKTMQVNTGWDIKPKTQSYNFTAGQYQELDNVGFVQLTDDMDATLSFWVNTSPGQGGTIFSNGRGNGDDEVQSNGFANKWSVSLTNAGILEFANEGTDYQLTTESIADDTWHHVTLLLNRSGALSTYVDGAQVTSNPSTAISGFSGNRIFIGARGFTDSVGTVTVDNEFEGQIDELRLWNTLRNIEQISRDRFNEIDFESVGLLLYARMNEPDMPTGNGPRYFHAFSNNTVISSVAVLNSGTVNYSENTPPIKPEREVISFQVNRIINGDEMIIEPVITDFASVEGQVLDITVHRMFDEFNNIQLSPITWTAFIDKNDVDWFANGFNNNNVEIVKESEEDVSFDITLVNRGGNNQPYTINNIPSWLDISETSGVLQPNSTIVLTATIDNSLSPGDYAEDLFLETDFNFDQKIQIDLKVLSPAPDWSVNPSDFEFSMNIIGRVLIDGQFSADEFDTVGAFQQGEVRGSAQLEFDENYQQYYVFLTVYSNEAFGEVISFRVWDASTGQVKLVTIDAQSEIAFQDNNVLGTFSDPVIFENTGNMLQEISLNQGFTWLSFNVNDANFNNLNALTQGMDLATSDRILSHSPSYLDTYYLDIPATSAIGWSGSLSANGGLSSNKMYKMYTANSQPFIVQGLPVNTLDFEFNIAENWNWLPYPFSVNNSLSEALALFNAEDGDVIKSQGNFAIYDPLNGWSGSLMTLESGKGYMIKATNAQTFKYPNALSSRVASRTTETIVAELENPEQTLEDYTMFSQNMNAVVKLPEGYNTLYAFDSNGDVKGVSTNQQVGNETLSFITVYGDVTEDLRFYVGNGSVVKPTDGKFSFRGNNVLGRVADPIVLNLLENTIAAYPNPFKDELQLLVNSNSSQNVKVQLFSITNQLVYTNQIEVSQGVNTYTINADIQSGVYFLKMTMNNEIFTEKIIKR